MTLEEPITNLIDFKDKHVIGVETVEYPFSLFIEVENGSKFSFDGIDLKDQKVLFQVNAEALKTDSITKAGGGHINVESFENKEKLDSVLTKYKADQVIYGFRVVMEDKNLQKELLKKIESKYGKGTKNPNTDNGLYWNLKKEHQYIFFAPDYDRLIVLNNTNLSKTCYWDLMNGSIDFGGCDKEVYSKELMKNTRKVADVKEKPTLVIDQNWNLDGLVLGKSNETDFVKSSLNQSFERTLMWDDAHPQVIYENNTNHIFLQFTLNNGGAENQKVNILEGYYIEDFNQVKVSFQNGIKPFSRKVDVMKLIGKDQIVDYDEVKFADYLEIKNPDYQVKLLFSHDKDINKELFEKIYVTKKPPFKP
ncbi:hypothetical protein [Pedobacter gandavensis]|uniref:hypothetical protein n=1 Tax=Pedobacter gandavensis TaxID=2679963 RepID=UPI0029311FC2|nr:hypothetical protein [Pedobacter gandavensis]